MQFVFSGVWGDELPPTHIFTCEDPFLILEGQTQVVPRDSYLKCVTCGIPVHDVLPVRDTLSKASTSLSHYELSCSVHIHHVYLL